MIRFISNEYQFNLLNFSSNKLDEALKQFYQLESQNNLSPNSETYSILIMAMSRDKRVLPVENLFIQMRNV